MTLKRPIRKQLAHPRFRVAPARCLAKTRPRVAALATTTGHPLADQLVPPVVVAGVVAEAAAVAEETAMNVIAVTAATAAVAVEGRMTQTVAETIRTDQTKRRPPQSALAVRSAIKSRTSWLILFPRLATSRNGRTSST